MTRKNDIIDFSSAWKAVRNWRRTKNILWGLNVCILLFAFAPRLGFEMPFEKKNDSLYGIINTENSLNLRSLPYLDAEIVTKIPANESVEIMDESEIFLVIDGKSANWLKVKFKNAVGWVWGGYVRKGAVNHHENILNEKSNPPILSEKKRPKVVNVIGNGNHSSEKPFVDSDDCYDKYELDLIKDRKLNFVSKGKGDLELYEGKNVRFCYRDLDDKVGGELVIDGVEYSVSGYYSAEGNYESSVWKSEENFGVMYWNVWHNGDCMSLTIKLNCKESEIEVCKKKTNSNVWGNDSGGRGKESDGIGSGRKGN